MLYNEKCWISSKINDVIVIYNARISGITFQMLDITCRYMIIIGLLYTAVVVIFAVDPFVNFNNMKN